jgi:class 3 adenylate cyclase
VQCAKCGQDNPSKAIYCMYCSAELGKKCPKCDTLCPIGAQYCINCAAEFPSIESSQQFYKENRLVTAMFVDISGSTKRFSAIPQDELDEIPETIQTFINICKSIAQRYDGNTNDAGFQGDGLLILFGISGSHEEVPQSAICAALDIKDAMQNMGLPVHIGINTAIMPTGNIEIQSKFRTALGGEIALANRLMAKAKAWQIIVGAGTYGFAKNAFEFKPLTISNLKGFSKNIRAYEVTGKKIHPDKVREVEDLQPGFIGREEELATLKECADKLTNGEGQIVSIVGIAGVGKSRLVSEFLEHTENIRYLKGRCSSIDRSTAYSIFTEIFKDYFGLFSKDSSLEITGKIVTKIKELFPDKWQEVAGYIENLLTAKYDVKKDVPKSLLFRRHQESNLISKTICDLFVTLAKQKPLLLIFDDMNNADDSSMAIIYTLMEETTNVPLMLLCIYKPESEHESWHIATRASRKYHNRFTEIKLEELTQQESLKMLGSILQTEALSKEVKENIIKKSDCNPFYMEEIIRLLIDKTVIYHDGEKWTAKEEIKDIEIPDKIHAVIQERIDKLNDENHAILKYASVIGRDFSNELLQYSLQRENLARDLRQLEDKEFIYKEHAIPEEFRFKYDTTKDFVYQSMLPKELRFIHQRIGEGIEQLYSDRIEEYYEDLALHYTHTDCILKAIDYSYRAGIKTKNRYAYEAATKYFEKTLNLIESQPLTDRQFEMQIHEVLGDIYFTIGNNNQSERYFNQALKLANEQKKTFIAANLTCKLADIYHWQVDYDKAIEVAKSGLVILDRQIAVPQALSLLEIICRSFRAKRNYKLAGSYAKQMEKIIYDIPYFDSIYKAYYELAFLDMFYYKNYQSSENWLKEMERICLDHNDEVGLARFYHGMADLFWHKSDLHQSVQWLKKSLDYCERVGDAHWLMEGHLELARYLLCLNEDLEQVELHIQQGLKIAEQMSGTSGVASAPELMRFIADEYIYKSKEKASLCYMYAIELGCSNSDLIHNLNRLERIHAVLNTHDVFLDLCQKIQSKRQSYTKLHYWYLQDILRKTDNWQISWNGPFNKQLLDKEWLWIDPEANSNYSFEHSNIIKLYKLNNQDSDTSHNSLIKSCLIRQISDDFAIETNLSLTDIQIGESHMGGLVILSPGDICISFGKGLPDTNEMLLRICQKGQSDIIGRGWVAGNKICLRLEFCEDSISAICCNDNGKWQSCGKISYVTDKPLWTGLYFSYTNEPWNFFMHFEGVKLFQKVTTKVL